MKRILVLHGPNLNLLGGREPEVYGKTTLYEINRLLEREAKKLGVEVVTFQSNSEDELVEAVHRAKGNFDAAIVNAGAFTHYSYALRDALTGVALPFVEVHISNVFAREGFRKGSVLSDVAIGVVSGFGAYSYVMALRFLVEAFDGAN